MVPKAFVVDLIEVSLWPVFISRAPRGTNSSTATGYSSASKSMRLRACMITNDYRVEWFLCDHDFAPNVTGHLLPFIICVSCNLWETSAHMKHVSLFQG